MTVSENIALQSYYCKPDSAHGVLKYNYMNEHARHLIEQFDIRTSSEKKVKLVHFQVVTNKK